MVQFPQVDTLTEEQIVRNAAAAKELVRGQWYIFDPPITATGFPTGRPEVHTATELDFQRGWYIGLVDSNHVFQGAPVNDPRTMPTPQGYEGALNLEEILEKLRECYFHVLFVGGSVATLDPNQNLEG